MCENANGSNKGNPKPWWFINGSLMCGFLLVLAGLALYFPPKIVTVTVSTSGANIFFVDSIRVIIILILTIGAIIGLFLLFRAYYKIKREDRNWVNKRTIKEEEQKFTWENNLKKYGTINPENICKLKSEIKEFEKKIGTFDELKKSFVTETGDGLSTREKELIGVKDKLEQVCSLIPTGTVVNEGKPPIETLNDEIKNLGNAIEAMKLSSILDDLSKKIDEFLTDSKSFKERVDDTIKNLNPITADQIAETL